MVHPAPNDTKGEASVEAQAAPLTAGEYKQTLQSCGQVPA